MIDKEYDRIRWRCRRGKLEIDLFLVPFFENCYRDLSADEKKEFIALLEEHDPDLHAYLMAEKEPSSHEQKQLIDKIREYRFTVSRNQFL